MQNLALGLEGLALVVFAKRLFVKNYEVLVAIAPCQNFKIRCVCPAILPLYHVRLNTYTL
ncbi:hypothetical protein [Okeania sp. SIO2B3]|uniref:hypothetical protein n=1 Tax=Okeania sp. SIO2B3 TaxID=2607784 RepID=UPI0013C04255|nr:hypothetical protein [Okeania sp. SIO2B3]NET45614.1 hypothetical protein [Okeania sp. SIO2B3]